VKKVLLGVRSESTPLQEGSTRTPAPQVDFLFEPLDTVLNEIAFT
jgi:hypothetical protein